ncbi:rare lipoprotein A [Colletotrichum navitas]|uniref:Rare lipoprotein A n=1 Tax=Colletotrichum navitas TaxID=681940 RepID=A0AAD8QEF7_9PEZI|nr:rare lipoprotein A [Colletotrichum navitas]KAK1600639.1 rare lipoprotein A [Colletotrichum navitas]
MKYHILLLAAAAAHMALAKPHKVGRAKQRFTTVNTLAAGPISAPVQPMPVRQVAPVASAETPATSPVLVTQNAVSSPTSANSDDGGTSGRSTFYGGNTAGGKCSFSTYQIPSGLYGTAFSGQVWNSAAHCGACVKVTGPKGNSLVAMIVDECPECIESHLDLFQDAFAQLGSLSDGIISTSYIFVNCGITSPIKLHNKSGTSAYWFSMQVLNHNEPVSALEVSTDGGSTWEKTTRQPYNFFENPSGFGTDSVDVRVTAESGKTVIVRNVSVKSDSEHNAASNF